MYTHTVTICPKNTLTTESPGALCGVTERKDGSHKNYTDVSQVRAFSEYQIVSQMSSDFWQEDDVERSCCNLLSRNHESILEVGP